MANSRDRQILNSIINPLLPIGEGVHDLEQECFVPNLEDEISDRKETRISKQFEKDGIDAAEKGNIEEAVALFGQGMYCFIKRLIILFGQYILLQKCFWIIERY